MNAQIDRESVVFDTIPWIKRCDELDPIIQRIRELGELRAGWNYGKGQPVSETVIQLGEEMAGAAMNYGLTRLDAFPGIDGQLTVAIYISDADHSFQIHPSGEVVYWQETDPNSDEVTVGFNEAIEMIKMLSWNSCITSTSGTGTGPTSIFVAKPLSPQVMVAGSPWLTMNASLLPLRLAAFAFTLVSSTPQSVPSLQFFGNSIEQSSQAVVK